MKPDEEKEERANPGTATDRDTTYGSDFAYRVNRIPEARWKRYTLWGGVCIGLLMGGVLFGIPSTLLAESARLVIAFVIGVLPVRFLEHKAERSMRFANIGIGVAFVACMIAFVVLLFVNRG